MLLRRFALAVCAWSILEFVGTATVLQVLRRHLDPWTDTLSEYFVGPGGGWLIASCLALALGLILFGLYVETEDRSLRLERFGYLIAGAGAAVAGLVVPPRHLLNSWDDLLLRIHFGAAAIAFVALTLVALKTSWRHPAVFNPGWQRGLARVLVLLVIGLELLYGVLWPRSTAGSYEKLMIIFLAGWMSLRWTRAVSSSPV